MGGDWKLVTLPGLPPKLRKTYASGDLSSCGVPNRNLPFARTLRQGDLTFPLSGQRLPKIYDGILTHRLSTPAFGSLTKGRFADE